MAKQYYRATSRLNLKKKSTIKYGKPFKSKKGKYGCYKYVNGKRVCFLSTSGDYVFDGKWIRRF